MTDEPDHTITLLDSYTPAELRTMEPGEEMLALLGLGEAFETDDEPANIGPATAKFILDHVDEHHLEHTDSPREEAALARLTHNGITVECVAVDHRATLRSALAACRAYLRLLKAGAERGSSDLRGMAEREAMTE